MDNEKSKAQKIDGGASTTEEKAQYEVFKNGELPRATLDKWIRTDLESAMSVLHAIRHDDTIFKAVGDAFEARYRKLHSKQNENGGH